MHVQLDGMHGMMAWCFERFCVLVVCVCAFSLVCLLMIFITWNCQGAASREFLRAARLLIKTHNPSLLALFETKMSGRSADDVCRKLNYNSWIRVEAIGFSGGIWLMWNEDLDIQISHTHPQFIVTEIKRHNRVWNMVFVYASPDHYLRGKLWDDLRERKINLHGAWMAVGDFNVVTGIGEVSNPETFNQRRCAGINDWIF